MDDGFTTAIARSEEAVYPMQGPFHPHRAYPEYDGVVGDEPNYAYDAVREALRLSGLDAARFNTPQWNPLGGFISPGQFVLLKPNLVKETHPRDPQGWVYTITHGSVIRAVADYVWKALGGRGRVMVADAPQTDSDFAAMVRLLKLDEVQQWYRSTGLNLEIADLRKEQWENRDNVIVARHQLPGDPQGYQAFDLAGRSEFVGHGGGGRYYGADYDEGEVNRHHTGGRHEYLISGSAVGCDVFVNLPKLKTHKKTGITVNLKNLVGVNGDKNWLPHHTCGSPSDGGDQFPSLSLKCRIEHASAATLRRFALSTPKLGNWLLRRARGAGKRVFGDTDQVVRSGNWFGNDTAWRMCLDLNKIVMYGNADGSLRAPLQQHRKTYLSFVDGIIGGQGDGPMNPDPLDAQVILFGSNPAAVDACAAVLLGFDVEAIPLVRNAFHCRGFSLADGDWSDVRCASNEPGWEGRLGEIARQGPSLDARAHFGWVGHVERDSELRMYDSEPLEEEETAVSPG